LDGHRYAAAAAAADSEFTRRDERLEQVSSTSKPEAPLARGSGRRATAASFVAVIAGGLIGLSGAVRAAVIQPMPIGPLVQVIDTDERDDHADISVQFSCSARYIANTPISHGNHTSITLRLGPDCGSLLNAFLPEVPLVGGGGTLVTGARVDSVVPGEVTLEINWSRDLDFVMAPTASGLGLRLRLIGISNRKASTFIAEAAAPAGYAVNLDSSLSAIPHESVAAAASALQTQAYESETDIGEQHWYRLRVGPFATRQEADRVLQAALPTYPRAWLAVNDEQTDLAVVEHAGVPLTPTSAPTDAPLPDAERAALLHDARAALENHQYPEAVDRLNRLLRQPEFPARADAQELLGLVRERAGQFAQAKAEYEEYLRRYPEGTGAARVRARLHALLTASITPKTTGEFGAPEANHATIAGSAALTYQFEKDTTVAAGTTTTATSVNAALIYGDLLLRDRGERYDFTMRIDAGYTENIVNTFGGSQDRTTAAYVELTDRVLGLTGRVGRQSLASQGVIGLFDGVFVGYQLNPKWSVSAAAGLPAYTSYSAFSTQTKFGTVTAEFDPLHQAWVFDAYLFDETDENTTDRRSIGLQTRYSAAGRTAVVLVDYDIAFQQLNSATVIGNAKVGDHWVMGFDADHRRSPLLQLSNALIGQAATDLTTLESEFTPSQIKQLALDRTATSNSYVLSASRPLGERWQFMVDLAALELSGTPASGGVAATPSTGLDKSATLQISGSSLMQSSDLHIFGLRYDNDSPISSSTTLSWDARFVVHGAWRLGPRLSVERLSDPALGGTQMLYLPQIRGDWTGRKSVFELTAGYQLQLQQALQQQQSVTGQPESGALDQRSLYISATYRLRF
jgi:tetratricopeptide (TPR) repeat protein